MTEEIEILRTGPYALEPHGPVIDCVAGETYPFPLRTAKELLEAGVARRPKAPFVIDESWDRVELRKRALQAFKVDPDPGGKKSLAQVVEIVKEWIGRG
jgi:hypothetical protein